MNACERSGRGAFVVIGYWLLVIGYWLLVIGYWLGGQSAAHHVVSLCGIESQKVWVCGFAV